jgi:hypothetical protein
LDSLFSSSPAVHAIAPPYPSSVAGTSETVAMPRVAPTPQPVPRVAPMSLPAPRAAQASPSAFSSGPHATLASRFAQPPLCTSDDIQLPHQSPPALGRWSTTPSPWLVTPQHPPDGHPSCCRGHQTCGSSTVLCRRRSPDTVSGSDLCP